MDILSKLPDKSIDLVLTDPPYGSTSYSWDAIFPIDIMWHEFNRIITDNGTFCIFGNEPYASQVRVGNLANYKYDWIWVKSKLSGYVHVKNRPGTLSEYISVYCKAPIRTYLYGKITTDICMTYNPQGLIPIGGSPRATKLKNRILGKKTGAIDALRYATHTNYPNNILKYPVFRNTNHPSEKPLDLIKWLVKTHSNENDIVLDPFLGSGTTAVACKQLNRRYIGIEINPEYCKIAERRLAQGELFNQKRQEN